ncbi:MAG: hypothetical protein V1839_04165 [archaeon]
MPSFEKEIKAASEMTLVNTINQLEGFAWRLNHDAADGRIEDNVDGSIKSLMKQVQQAASELKARTGIKDDEKLGEYIRLKLKEQDIRWDAEWAALHTEGAVFQSKKKLPVAGAHYIWETVRAYGSPDNLKDQHILARAQNLETRGFVVFDSFAITHIEKVDTPPIYRGSLSGIITVDEEKEKRSVKYEGMPSWAGEYFRDNGAVFYHAGFKQVFETLGSVYCAIPSGKDMLDVILAKSYQKNVIVEFTQNDVPSMNPLCSIKKPKYTKIVAAGPGYRHTTGGIVLD